MRIFTVIIILTALFWREAQAQDRYDVEIVVQGLDWPWSFTFLPDGNMLVTELVGQLRLIRAGKLVEQPIAGVPSVYYAGQGGLMDVVLHPNYKRNKLIYLSYTSKTGDDEGATSVMRARFNGKALTEQKVIFQAYPSVEEYHQQYGSRMAFMRDGTLLITLGNGYYHREEAQNIANHFGTIVRLKDDGSVPKDNPFIHKPNAKPEIWTYGHRNVQGIVIDSKGRVFSNEHGEWGGDEVNLIIKGKNYGWPLITYSVHYNSGNLFSLLTRRRGLEPPLWYWSIVGGRSFSPSSIAIYEGKLFPKWRGDLLMTSLNRGQLIRLDMEGDRVIGYEILFNDETKRPRCVRIGPEGAIYFLDEVEGEIFRLKPKVKPK